ncbi:hypothetical protein AAEX28_02710 [Lentisphaerota bacterium WC36G]|nr:hypothetical protein LJT99_05590 [Lentisphaerae bacterium WC36]
MEQIKNLKLEYCFSYAFSIIQLVNASIDSSPQVKKNENEVKKYYTLVEMKDSFEKLDCQE